MLRNYLTVAIRTLFRDRIYAVLNLLGLAVGLACVILIALFTQNELRYDRHHKKGDRIYRIVRETRKSGSKPRITCRTSGPLGPVVSDSYPEAEEVVRTLRLGVWAQHGDTGSKQIYCLADENILEVFDFTLVKGNPQTALREPSSMVLTEKAARKYFGHDDPIGKVITIEDDWFGSDYLVAGVLKDIPENSTLQFDFLTTPLSTPRLDYYWTGWRPTRHRFVETYVLLPPGFRARELERKLPDLMERHLGKQVRADNTYHLQRFCDIYLYSRRDFDISGPGVVGPHGRLTYGDIADVHMSALIGSFILLIACINFMNLATARSARRAREVGVRKAAGARRCQVVGQFLAESILTSFLGLLLALPLVQLVLPSFSVVLGRRLSLSLMHDQQLLLGLLVTTTIVGLMAGAYPAAYLSAYRPVEVLKGRLGSSSRSAGFRKGLVVFQFAISILLTIATATVHSQMSYMRHKDLGFDRDDVVVLPLFWTAKDLKQWGEYGMDLKMRYNAVKERFLALPGVAEASASQYTPGVYATLELFAAESTTKDAWQMALMEIDEDLLQFYGIELVAGRGFSREYVERDLRSGQESRVDERFLLNETATRRLGWEQPIGRRLEWVSRKRTGTVVGVVRDFHVGSLRAKLEPVVLNADLSAWKELHLKIRSDDTQATLKSLEEVWREYIPSRPFEYEFLGDQLDNHYRSEIGLGRALGIFSALAILVACLGLFGLAAHTTEQRTKEIGIRKALGATVRSTLALVTGEFTRIIVLANLLAGPLAYYAMDRWLQSFAYRVGLQVEVFLLGGGIAFTIALTTVSYFALKAATANPVDALRYE